MSSEERERVAPPQSHLSSHPTPRRSKSSPLLRIFFFALLLLGAYFLGVERGKFLSEKTGSGESFSGILSTRAEKTRPDLSTFWKTWDLLHVKFFSANELDSTKLVYGAIKGMLAATDDPYTTFFDPEENKIFEEDLSGTFEGIGAEIGIKDKILTIVAPLEGMPAERAGLRSGDKVLKINDEETSGMSVEEARDKMRGKKGTEVKLTVFREGDRETRDITVRRDVINVKSVKLTIRDDGIALLKVNTFGDDTAREFSNAVKEVASRKARGLILDLRDNPGGRLDAAIDMASALLPKGKVVVIEEDSDRKKSERLTSGKTLIGNLPTVILINEGSASASEILAAALRENRDDIRLVGKKSFGKGSVQELLSVTRETSLKVTVAHWLTPKGKLIDKEGIFPDIEVELSNEDYDAKRDPQLDKALEIVRATTVVP